MLLRLQREDATNPLEQIAHDHGLPFEREDGTIEWLRWELQPWRTMDGSIGGVVLFSEIISERKQREEERLALVARERALQ